MKALGLISSLLLVLSGCSTFVSYQMQVESKSYSISPDGLSYVLISAVEGDNAADFATYINQTLKENGYHESADSETADMAILLSYGIGDPQTHHYEYLVPVRGQIGTPSFTLNSTVQSMVPTGTVNNFAFRPPPGVTDYRPHAGTRTTSLRFLVLEAMDLKEYRDAGSVVPVWKTTVTSIGSSRDLRRIFPALVAVAAPYIGKTTGQQLTVSLRDIDDRVQQVRSSLPATQ